ncbi:YciE/YciF ferroxidase family protein [Bradyrhizobium sp. USDA 4353]
MAQTDKTLEDLFLILMQDTYSAEKQVLRALGKMERAAESERLAAALDAHRTETEVQIERLQQIFELLGKPARGKPCEAMQSMLDEADEILQEFKGSEALDAGLIAAQQAVEHYEITRYGTLKSWAEELGLTEAVPLLGQTLEEERKTDAILSLLAKERVNVEAAEA